MLRRGDDYAGNGDVARLGRIGKFEFVSKKSPRRGDQKNAWVDSKATKCKIEAA